MDKNQKGLAPLVVILITIVALSLGVYVMQRSTNFFPSASEDPFYEAPSVGGGSNKKSSKLQPKRVSSSDFGLVIAKNDCKGDVAWVEIAWNDLSSTPGYSYRLYRKDTNNKEFAGMGTTQNRYFGDKLVPNLAATFKVELLSKNESLGESTVDVVTKACPLGAVVTVADPACVAANKKLLAQQGENSAHGLLIVGFKKGVSLEQAKKLIQNGYKLKINGDPTGGAFGNPTLKTGGWFVVEVPASEMATWICKLKPNDFVEYVQLNTAGSGL